MFRGSPRLAWIYFPQAIRVHRGSVALRIDVRAWSSEATITVKPESDSSTLSSNNKLKAQNQSSNPKVFLEPNVGVFTAFFLLLFF
jgi:hypothetical protein